MLRRIAIDWDFKNTFLFIFYLRRVISLNPHRLIIKATKKGYHVFIWTHAKGKRFELRKYLGDDKKHLAMDKLHFYGRQTMFGIKRKFKWKKKKATKR